MITDTRSRNCPRRAGTRRRTRPLASPKGGTIEPRGDRPRSTGATSSTGCPTTGSPSCAGRRPSTGTPRRRRPGAASGPSPATTTACRSTATGSTSPRPGAASLFHDMDEDQLAQQQLMMVNMDPTMHTRYRRLVNKGFTPRMVRDLEAEIVGVRRRHHRRRVRAGHGRLRRGDLGRAATAGHRRAARRAPGGPPHGLRLVQPHDRLRRPRVPDRRRRRRARRPWSCSPTPRSWPPSSASSPTQDLVSGPARRRGRRREAEPARARPLLPPPGRGRQRDHPEPDVGRHGGLLRPPRPVGAAARADRSLLPAAVEEMLRYVTPVMHFRRTGHRRRGARRPEDRGGRQGRVLAHLGQPGRDRSSTDPDTFDITRIAQQPHGLRRWRARTSASAPTWPAWRSG